MKFIKKEKVKDKTKSKDRKKIILGFVIGVFFTSIVGVGAASVLLSSDVTYDNSNSGLSSTNLQDALDELYEQAKSAGGCPEGFACTPLKSIADLTANIVTSGSGLYADSVESGRYIYRGSEPNNYIMFNNETWRIISVESDETLKIIKDSSIGNKTWDSSGNRSTTGYCNYSNYGCNSWGSKTTMTPTTMAREIGGTSYILPSNEATLNQYLNETYYNSLSNNAQSQIVSHTFNVGVVGTFNDNNAIAILVTREQSNKWTGKIGLMTITEFMRTTTGTSCTSLNTGYGSTSACSSNNWMFKEISEWTLSPNSDSASYQTWYVNSNTLIKYTNSYNTNAVRPVVYLSSSITLGGSGTSTDPYTIN